MSQACAGWRGDIGAYVIGALVPAEAATVRRHLRGCAGCRSEFQDLVPLHDWLARLGPADGTAARHPPITPQLKSPRRLGHDAQRRWLTTIGAAIATAAIVVITAVAAHPAPRGFHAFDPATGVHGQASLRATPAGTQIELTLTGLRAGQRCTLITASRTGAVVAGTWNAADGGTAQVTGTSAIPVSQLTSLRIEAPSHRLLLSIPV